MKALAQILIAVSLTLGVLMAANAYLAPLSFGARLSGLTLAAPAGGTPGNPPIAPTDTELTTEVVEQLRAAGVKYVKVKQLTFNDLLSRWPGRWPFVGAATGLALGAFMVRRANRASIASALRPDATKERNVESPDEALAGLRVAIATIERDVKLHADDSARLAVIADRIGEAQKTHVDSFLQARSLLQGRLGLAGFGRLMDRFSVGERQLNRAWSAAVDGVYDEAIDCVRTADRHFAEAERALQGR